MNNSKVTAHLHTLKIQDIILNIQQGIHAILGTIPWRLLGHRWEVLLTVGVCQQYLLLSFIHLKNIFSKNEQM